MNASTASAASLAPLRGLFERQQVWQGRRAPPGPGAEPTGWPELDAALPQGGWPRAALTEILLPADGVGELRLLLPTLARLTGGGQTVAVVAPPYRPYAPGWCLHGVDLARIEFIHADDRQTLWAMEQCLRSGSCVAVLGWPRAGDSRHLRRLQVAADTGQALAFVFRSDRHAGNPSPAALRLDLLTQPQPALRIRKCRGGQPPSRPMPLPAAWP
ncbi:MAG: translesion DNA synthesis-associated protein ImuA [Xanthomonadales bacterium]|nr:translesion DNA synthesis-associated protein ImuA [Xanthomonadales bacterium]